MSNPASVHVLVDYKKLKGLAQSIIKFESQCTLSATALVHELYLKSRAQKNSSADKPNAISPQFAARMMKQILIDRARSRIARKKLEAVCQKRKSQHDCCEVARLQSILDFDELVDQLSSELPENGELVRLHVYSEYSVDECAKILGISRATAYRKWQFSKAWLQRHIS